MNKAKKQQQIFDKIQSNELAQESEKERTERTQTHTHNNNVYNNKENYNKQ